MRAHKKLYSAPELVEFGRIEDLTSTKSWHAANDWLGEVIDMFVPGNHDSIIGNSGTGTTTSSFS